MYWFLERSFSALIPLHFFLFLTSINGNQPFRDKERIEDIRYNELIMVGDMGLTKKQFTILYDPRKVYRRSIAKKAEFAPLWNEPVHGQPGKVGVPYMISDNFTDAQKEKFLPAVKEIEDNTCIKFLPYVRGEHDYHIHIVPSESCSSLIGRQHRSQMMNISFTDLSGDRSCRNAHGTILHEFLHALGFKHEHSHFDRDRYVTLIDDGSGTCINDNNYWKVAFQEGNRLWDWI
jgi:hypothetical protein